MYPTLETPKLKKMCDVWPNGGGKILITTPKNHVPSMNSCFNYRPILKEFTPSQVAKHDFTGLNAPSISAKLKVPMSFNSYQIFLPSSSG